MAKLHIQALLHMVQLSAKNFAFLIFAAFTVWLMLCVFSFILTATGEQNPQYQAIFSEWIFRTIAVHLETVLVFLIVAITLPVIFQSQE